MYLHNYVPARHRVMVHVGIEICEAACWKTRHFGVVEGIAHADFECAGDDGHIFTVGMPVRRYAVAIRHLDANREVAGRCRRITLQHGDLRTGCNEWRWRSPRNCVGRYCIVLLALGSSCTDWRNENRRQHHNCEHYIPDAFHMSLLTYIRSRA